LVALSSLGPLAIALDVSYFGRMETPKEIKLEILTSVEYTTLVSQVRGKIIHNCTILEKIMDDAIARHFCSNEEKRHDMFIFILATERITWMNKHQVLGLIFNRQSAINAPNKYSRFIENNPDFVGDIQKIIENRNIFAHYLLDTSDQYLNRFQMDGFIRFLKFKVTDKTPDVSDYKWTVAELEEIADRVKQYGIAINALNNQ
jgi:hypothetical protein